MRQHRGYTLIELMLAVGIVGILASIAVPQFGTLLRKAHEGTTKANLGTLRSALSIYYADNEGIMPVDPASLAWGAKYLGRIPMAYTEPWHRPGNVIGTGSAAQLLLTDANVRQWFFYSDRQEAEWGRIVVTCGHTDANNRIWNTY